MFADIVVLEFAQKKRVFFLKPYNVNIMDGFNKSDYPLNEIFIKDDQTPLTNPDPRSNL